MIDINLLEKLNAPTAQQRLDNLKAILADIDFPPTVPQYINNHIHTTYSFSPYSPTAAVWFARAAGLCTCGLMDHDSIAGAEEFLAAAEAAKQLADLIGGKGKIAVIAHDQTSKSGTDRRDGFLEWMEGNAPDIEVVDVQYGDGDQLKSTDAAKAIIAANPDLAGMYGTNEGSAIGVVNAVKELNLKGKLTIVGFDSGKAQIDAIKDGTMAGAVTQNPVGIGYETVKAAVAAAKGESVDKVIDTGFYWYDAENIDSDEIKPNLYE